MKCSLCNSSNQELSSLRKASGGVALGGVFVFPLEQVKRLKPSPLSKFFFHLQRK